MDMNTFNKILYDSKIDQWMDDRGITENGTAMAQAIKTLEETTELLDAINHNNEAEIKDALGDIYVTLRGICKVKNRNYPSRLTLNTHTNYMTKK